MLPCGGVQVSWTERYFILGHDLVEEEIDKVGCSRSLRGMGRRGHHCVGSVHEDIEIATRQGFPGTKGYTLTIYVIF
jgi:hypothetical protein